MRLTPVLIGVVLMLPMRRTDAQAVTAAALALPPAMQITAGVWDWSGDSLTCRRNPHTISFTPDTAVMVVRYRTKPDSTGKLEYRYRIARYSDHTVTGQIEGEQRRNKDGKPVVWDLILTGPNSYRWRDADGNPQAVTRAIVRCGDSQPLSEAQ
jgi:hypothetical protein